MAAVGHAQSSCVGLGCSPELVDYEPVGVSNINPIVQETVGQGVYYPDQVAGPNVRRSFQTGFSQINDHRIATPASPFWRSACCDAPVRVAGCKCGKTVRRCRNRRIHRQNIQNRVDRSTTTNKVLDLSSTRPTIQTRNRRTFDFKALEIPSTVTSYDIEWREQLGHRTQHKLSKSYTPLTQEASVCNCYSPTCGCVGQPGCGCCYPACSCAPNPIELATHYRATPVTETFVRRYPVRVPKQESVTHLINQKIVTNQPVTTIEDRWVSKFADVESTHFNNKAVASAVPDTIQECWNEYCEDC